MKKQSRSYGISPINLRQLKQIRVLEDDTFVLLNREIQSVEIIARVESVND